MKDHSARVIPLEGPTAGRNDPPGVLLEAEGISPRVRIVAAWWVRDPSDRRVFG